MNTFSTVSLIVLVALVALSARGALAQSIDAPTKSAARTTTVVVGGIIGGIAGMVVGIAAGDVVDKDILQHTRSCMQCVRWGAACGAGVGTTIGSALGVHAFNRGCGRFLSVLGSTAAAVAGFWAASFIANRLGAEGIDDLLAIGGVVGGIYTAQRIERSTTPVPVLSVSLNML